MKWADPSGRIMAIGRSRTAAIACSAGYLVYFADKATGFKLSSLSPFGPRGDAAAIYRMSSAAVAHGHYPEGIFPYPPSGVLVFAGLGAAGPSAFAAVWYVLMAAGLALAVRASLAGETPDIRAAWPVLGLIAVVLTRSSLRWDLTSANSNLIYLGVTMAGYSLLSRRPTLAGMMIGLSVSLKIYSCLLLLWLMINGARRTLLGAAGTLVILWIVAPILLFGVGGAETFYVSWREQLQIVSDPIVQQKFLAITEGPAIESAWRAIVVVTGGRFDSFATRAWLCVLWSAWIASLLWYAWRSRKAYRISAPSRAALADWAVLLLAPLPFSPWLEPYHVVSLLVGALLCALVALDERSALGGRIAALCAICVLLLLLAAPVPADMRGFVIISQLLTVTTALGFIRPSLRETHDSNFVHGNETSGTRSSATVGWTP